MAKGIMKVVKGHSVNQEDLDLRVKNLGGTQACKIRLMLKESVLKYDPCVKMLKIRKTIKVPRKNTKKTVSEVRARQFIPSLSHQG